MKSNAIQNHYGKEAKTENNIMKSQLEQRLKELKAEFEAGQKMLADLEAKRANLQNTLLRITGAIQVLQEELSKADGENSRVAESAKMEAET